MLYVIILQSVFENWIGYPQKKKARPLASKIYVFTEPLRRFYKRNLLKEKS